MIKNSIETITVNKTELRNIESLLVKTNFELSEIWTPDEDNEVQIWFNKKLKKNIQVTISENEPIEDNTTKVINELVDLWLELRAIRNAVEYNEEDYAYQTLKEPTAAEKYKSKVKELEEEWEEWNKRKSDRTTYVGGQGKASMYAINTPDEQDDGNRCQPCGPSTKSESSTNAATNVNVTK